MDTITNLLNNNEFEIFFILWLLLIIALIIIDSIFIYKYFKKSKPIDPNTPTPSNNKLLVIIFLFNIVFIGLISYLTFDLFFKYPKMISTYPVWDTYWNDYNRPIEVVFDRPIDTKSLVLNMSPETSGIWKYEKSFPILPFVRTVKFVPNETVYPGNKVITYFTHVTNFFNNHDNREEFLQFYSVDLPVVNFSTPEKDSTNVPIDQEINFKLSHKEGEFVDWEIKVNKDDPYKLVADNTDVIKVQFEDKLKQNEEYIIKLYQVPVAKDRVTSEVTKKGEGKLAYTVKFKTVAAPLVSSLSPQSGGVLVNEKIKIEFDEEMNRESVESSFSITPNIAGTKSWPNEKTFMFTPGELKKGTHYNVNLKAGIKNKFGGQSEEPVSYSFDTIGAVKVTGWSPRSGAGGVEITSPVRVTFDQAVDHASAESNFSISPNLDGVFSWSGNTMIFDQAGDFQFSTEYTATVAPGVKTINGLDSTATFSSSFSTQAKRVQLNVPLYRQVNSKECQVVATQMLLGFKGKGKNKTTIFNELPKQDVACDAENNIWGNPQLGFIGDINGNHDCASGNRGYGIYWSPISSYLSRNGVSNQVRRGMSISQLTQELEGGHPVMLWWQNGWSAPTDISWNTPDGQSIYAVNGMHSEIAIGFVGPNDNPTHIIVNDPWRGRREISIGTFKGLWSYFNNTGIVVY